MRYATELDQSVHETNTLAALLRKLAEQRGEDVAADAMAEGLDDANASLVLGLAVARALVGVEADGPTTRLLGHAAFLASALHDRTPAGQARREDAEREALASLRDELARQARDAADEVARISRAKAADAAAGALLDALPLLWAGRSIVLQRDADVDPDEVVMDVAALLDALSERTGANHSA